MITTRLFPFVLLSIFVSSFVQAQKTQTFGVEITVEDGNRINWTVLYPEGEEKRTEEDEAKLLETTILRQVLIGANAGKLPDAWQVGFFYADGRGTPKDLRKAGEAFRIGLPHGQFEGTLFLARLYRQKGIVEKSDPDASRRYFEKSADLFLSALKAGSTDSIPDLVWAADARNYGWYRLAVDEPAAENIFAEIDKVDPEHFDVLYARTEFSLYKRLFQKAWEYAERAIAAGDKLPESSRDAKKYEKLRMMRMTAAYSSGNASKLDPEEVKELIQKSFNIPAAVAWGVPAFALFLLLCLVFFTWLSRKTGPGIFISCLWILLSLFVSGIGFMVKLPGLDNVFGKWIGAILVAFSCLLAIFILGRDKYLGQHPWLTSLRSTGRIAALFAGIILAMELVGIGYSFLYEKLMGQPIPPQFVATLIASENTFELVATVFVAGVLIPFYEEVPFRGFLFDAIKRQWNAKVALVATSIGFAIAHGFLYAIPILFLAIALGLLRLKTGNLRLSFLLHALNNTFATLWSHYAGVPS